MPILVRLASDHNWWKLSWLIFYRLSTKITSMINKRKQINQINYHLSISLPTLCPLSLRVHLYFFYWSFTFSCSKDFPKSLLSSDSLLEIFRLSCELSESARRMFVNTAPEVYFCDLSLLLSGNFDHFQWFQAWNNNNNFESFLAVCVMLWLLTLCVSPMQSVIVKPVTMKKLKAQRFPLRHTLNKPCGTPWMQPVRLAAHIRSVMYYSQHCASIQEAASHSVL